MTSSSSSSSAGSNSHGNTKLDIACRELDDHLAGLSRQLLESSSSSSSSTHRIAFGRPPTIEVLRAALPSHIYHHHAHTHNTDTASSSSASDDGKYKEGAEEEGYRCKCAFQIVRRSCLNDDTTTAIVAGDDDDDDDGHNVVGDHRDDADTDGEYIYVTRGDGRMRPLPTMGNNGTTSHYFPPANPRIRRAMADLMNCLNRRESRNDENNATGNDDANETESSSLLSSSSSSFAFERLRTNLTSATFVTSWGDYYGVDDGTDNDDRIGGGGGGDCLVTLHYGPPGLLPISPSASSCPEAHWHWRDEAASVCGECDLVSLTGRSRGVKVSVIGPAAAGGGGGSSDPIEADGSSYEGIVRDDLWLTLRPAAANPTGGGRASATIDGVEGVTLVRPPPTTTTTAPDGCIHVPVRYRKPESAFQHPNAGVMLSSLRWILNVLADIVKEEEDEDGTAAGRRRRLSLENENGIIATTGMMIAASKRRRRRPRLLEMYCGCGAHTVPLARSGLLSEISAVELDGRLVDACRANCRSNGCLMKGEETNTDTDDDPRRRASKRVRNNGDHRRSEEGYRGSSVPTATAAHVGNGSTLRPPAPCDGGGGTTTPVRVFEGDAAEWAARTLRGRRRRHPSSSSSSDRDDGHDDGDNDDDFDILLVDPPRNGLSPTVCDMALGGTFRRVIYVSCGRRALLRDLTILCGGGFDVADLAVIDLFPGTDAVETLVHLKRR